MMLRAVSMAAALGLVLASTPSRADDLPMSVDQFKLWRDYQSALQDERVQKMPENKRLPAIAKNFRVSEKELREAVEKGDQHGASMAKLSEDAIRAKLADTELAPRIKNLRVDASAAHVIAYLSWTAGKRESAAVDREVCLAAARAFQGNALVSTFKVEVLDPVDGTTKIFQALISRSAAGRIRESSIIDFASTRYLKLFEKVERTEL